MKDQGIGACVTLLFVVNTCMIAGCINMAARGQVAIVIRGLFCGDMRMWLVLWRYEDVIYDPLIYDEPSADLLTCHRSAPCWSIYVPSNPGNQNKTSEDMFDTEKTINGFIFMK